MTLRSSPSIMMLATVVACGGAPVAPPTPRAAAPDPAPVPDVQAEEPAAPGTQLAAGRLGAELDALAPGTWEVPGIQGPATEGPDAPTDHVWTRTTSAGDYALHVVAYESFEALPDDAELAAAAAAQAGVGEPVVLEADDPELGVAAVFAGPEGLRSFSGPDLAMMGRGRRVLARLAVAVRGGTFVYIALVCEPSEACAADDPRSAAAELARSLRHGPRLRGGGAWSLRLPDGDADRRVTITLPEDVVGLTPRLDGDGDVVAPAISLVTGVAAVTFRVRSETWGTPPEHTLELGSRSVSPDPFPSTAQIECAPFRCQVRFARDAPDREALAAALMSAEVERAPAQDERVSLARGRLVALLPGPALEPPTSDYDEGGDNPNDPATSIVRLGGARLWLVAHDTLRPTDDLLAAAREQAEEGDTVEALEAGDPSLSIVRITTGRAPSRSYSEFIPAKLLVAEAGSTTLVVELHCRHDTPCANEHARLTAELARRLRRGAPLLTTREWSVQIAGRTIAMELPEAYHTSDWTDPNHGGWGVRARHLRTPDAELAIESSGGAPEASIENSGERTGRRTRLRLGEETFVMRERRRSYDGSLTWGADLGCTGSACVILIRTADLPERDRLLEVLARARVTRRPPCLEGYVADEDDLNVRARPSTSAPVVGTLDSGEEVTLAETRGRWSRLTGSVEGWVWDRSVARSCE